ncbi:hypothetical protein CBER1_02381 [Cercospora berteroae]|uniref:C2H2-type domain-containing protein n=1 Tax=Cercospora berteroae TaxID=357750 RepID=A0A2S6CLY0_9PEZI|nr:hypothetical protein CBER1_02381 [Cercospora berteroae]
MADTTQLNSGYPTIRDNTDDEPLTLDPEEVAAITNYAFLDINDEETEYQRLFADQPKTAFTANVSEVPGLAVPALSDGPSTSVSCANSTIASRTPDSEHNGDDRNARDVRGLDEPHDADADFDLDDFVNPSAYEPSVTVKAEQQMPWPPGRHRYHSEPSVSTRIKMPPHAHTSPPGAYLSSPTEPGHELVRSISKRDRQDTSNDLTSTTKRAPSKRLKQQKGGYPCTHLGCADTFDRACDQKKHYQRTHAPKDSHPHSCPDCQEHGIVKTFLYPKDLRRHFKQVHSKIITNISAGRKASNASPVSATASKPLALRVLFKAVMSLKKLRITATTPQHKFIMVSQDQKSFTEVDVFDVFTPADLVSKILEPLKFDSMFPIQWVQAQTYSRQYGRVKLGQRLDAQSIFDLVMKDADSQGSLKLLISTADGYGDYSA